MGFLSKLFGGGRGTENGADSADRDGLHFYVRCDRCGETIHIPDAYADARHARWSEEERRVAWAAGLWNLAFDAKKASVDGIGESLVRLQSELEARLRLAGLD